MSGCSRKGYDLFNKFGRINFKEDPSWSLMWGDTFGRFKCMLLGHKPYNTAFTGEPDEWACHRCHHYLPKYSPLKKEI